MNKTNFSLELKKRFPPSDWPWLLLALRQDELVWDALQDAEFVDRALEDLPCEAYAWSPATLSLLKVDDPPGLDDLRSVPLQPLADGILSRASQAYERWLEAPQLVEGLDAAGLLALNLREQYRVSGSWEETLNLDGVEPDAYRTLLACLYGMVPEPDGLLMALLQGKNSHLVKSAVHALLANPNPPDTQLAILKRLSLEIDPSISHALLQTIASTRPNLAGPFARLVLAGHSTVKISSGDKMADGDGIKALEELVETLRSAGVRKIAGQAEMAVPALADSLRMIRKMRGHLSAQLAQSIASTKEVASEGWGNTAQEASVEAWKQAVQLSPEEPRYMAGYARALLKAGRASDAAEHLRSYIGDGSHVLQAELMLTYALVLINIGENENAQHAARQALELFRARPDLPEKEIVALVRIFLRGNEIEEALAAARTGLAAFPASRDLLSLAAKIQFESGRHEEAASSAYASLAASAYESSFTDNEVHDASSAGEAEDLSEPLDLDDRTILSILVESLEAIQAWEAAYNERLILLEGKEEITNQDMKSLARCGAGAEKHARVVEICEKLLADDPNDLDCHRMLAESSEALRDYERSMDHFKRALQLTPEHAGLWKGLVRVQQKSGQDSAAFETLRSASAALPEDADIQFQLGEQYFIQGAPTLALPYLRRAYSIAEPDGVPEGFASRLGEALHKLGRPQEARQVLEPVYLRLAESEPAAAGDGSNGLRSSRVGPELAHMYARTLLSMGEPEKAVPILTRVVRDRPQDVQAGIDLSKGLMQLSDHISGARRAIPFLQRMLGIGATAAGGAPNASTAPLPEDVEPNQRAEMRALLAEAYSSAGEWEKALDAYKKALEEPANQEPEMQTRLSMGLGMTALKLELPEMAVAALQEAAQAEPLNGQIQRSLSEAYYTNGLSQDAFQAAAAALQLAPKDIDMLSWFIDQGTRIAGLPGAAQHSIQEDVIQALRSALQQAPERADLLIRLGSLLFQSDRKADAIEVFRKLASVDTFTQKVSLRAIYKAGLEVLGAGDARLAVVLLRKAIAHLEDQDERVEPGKEGISLAELYEALVRALEVLGDLDGALEAIEQALKLDQARAALYSTKAEILLKLGDTENARQTLEIALARWPENVSLYQKMARLLRAMGDLPSALLQVEKGIAVVEESEEAVSGTDLFFLASRLAYATLRPRRAFAYLQKALPADDPDFNRFDNAIFRAELALESGEEQAAAQAVELFDAEAADSARALAASGRIGLRIGDREGGEKKCRSAVRMWTRLQKDQPGQTPATNIDDYLSELASMGMAALETRQWEQALSIFHQMVLMFPDEPQANIKYAQALAVCAEAQALCEDFEVVKNAPGKSSLLDPASQKFEESLRKAALKAGIGDILTSDGILEGKDVEIQRSIGLWVKRGRACFRPTMENAASLEFLLQSIMPGTDDVAALVMVYRRCGAKDRAKKSAIVGWQPVFEGRDPRTDPQVLAQLALAEDGLQQAIETVMECIAASASRGMGWPEVPMMQFFLSKLHYQAEDYEAAWQAVQLALGVWPNEPRWKAFAAQIQLARSSSNRPQQLGEAIGLLEQAASLEPEYGSHMLELGKIYLESEQYKRALQALEQAVHLDPQDAEGWLSLAQVQHLLSDLDQAALSAEKAIELSGDQIDPLLLRAEIAVKAKNFRAAMSRSQAVLRSKPDHPQALFLLAKSLSGLDRPTVALEALEKAISLSDAPLAMQLERLDLIKRADGLEAGLKALQELVAQNPKQAAFLGLLAGWLQEAGKQDAAIQAARLALQEGLEGLSSQQRADLHTMIGLHMRKLGQLDQAIHHLSEAVSKSSDHIDAYLELGTVYQERREFQQALKIYQKAINLAGGDYRPYYHAGLVLKDNKDYMAAEAMLRRAAQLAPNEVGVHRMLGAVVALNLVHSRRLVPGETGEYKS